MDATPKEGLTVLCCPCHAGKRVGWCRVHVAREGKPAHHIYARSRGKLDGFLAIVPG
jgi:hypothetical protein